VTDFAENLARIEERIAAACRRANRSRSEVALMGVSKTHPASAILEAVAAGVTLFGENRVQEFQQKSEQLAGQPIAVHLIGKLQSNKSAKAAEIFTAVDSLDSLRLARRLNETAAQLNKSLAVLIEIKLSHEESKSGLEPNSAELAELLEHLLDLPSLKPPAPTSASFENCATSLRSSTRAWTSPSSPSACPATSRSPSKKAHPAFASAPPSSASAPIHPSRKSHDSYPQIRVPQVREANLGSTSTKPVILSGGAKRRSRRTCISSDVGMGTNPGAPGSRS
jgi:hypothetical protein